MTETEAQDPHAKEITLMQAFQHVKLTVGQAGEILHRLGNDLRDVSPDTHAAFMAGADDLLYPEPPTSDTKPAESKPAEPTSFHTRGGKSKDDD